MALCQKGEKTEAFTISHYSYETKWPVEFIGPSVMEFNANGTERQSYELRKQLKGLHIDSLFRDAFKPSLEVLYSKLPLL
jgi:hypothetical protein